MKYIVKYLPVDKPWIDGCTIINSNGEHHIWDQSLDDYQKQQWRVAELFIVGNHFNEQVIICKPSGESIRWLKPGMEIYSWQVVQGITENTFHIQCPTCGHYPQ